MTGNPGLDRILLGVNGAVVLAATALVVYAHTMIKPVPTDEAKEFAGLVQESMRELRKSQVEFPEMVINLYSRETRLRFLNVSMAVETFNEGQIQVAQDHKAMIQDTLIDIASNMTPEELNSVTGRILLESRIKKTVNGQLSEPAIKKIYFSKFIVQ